MRALFIHRNMPGQFKHLAPRLAAAPGNQVVFLTQKRTVELPGVRRVTYAPSRRSGKETHRYVVPLEDAVLHGQGAVRTCLALKNAGFSPDIVIAHPGWGESLFVKDVYPQAQILSYCEFFYHAHGSDLGFDPSDPLTIDEECRVRVKNAHLLLALEHCDRGLAPTQWQRSVHPAVYQPKIETIFDGIDTAVCRPDPTARFTLPNGRVLTRDDEVVTYVARNFEPYRGFPSFVRSLPEILRRRPNALVVAAGGDEVSYGRRAPGGKTWREVMLAEVPLDPARVHFVGTIPYADHLALLRVSSAHLYLTVPFVLSWSVLEAMAIGSVVIASRTAPVEEVIADGENGYLVDFFDVDGIAERICAVLESRGSHDRLRTRARETILERYDLTRCLEAQLRLLKAMLS
jgi:glycosyltransferase involved in cell wall biosynthesis